MQITDDQGQVYSVAVLRQALNAIMDGDYDKPALDFTTISALGSTKTAQYLGVLNKQPENLRAYTALCDSLFTFSLYRFEDQSEHSEMAQIHEQTFMPGHAWQFKPINYQMDLESEFLAIHFEHSEIDGAALNHILNYAFALELDQQASKDSTPHWQLLDWVCDQVMATNIKQDVEVIRTQAEKITPQFAQVDYGAIYHNDSSIKVSHDAMMQLALLYAQLKIFGQVRHTYEAVDTSQFTAGRTEGMRPNSAEAIALCQALLSDNATQEQLKNAFTAHKQRVIACKTGQGFDRHLTGLKAMMSEASQDQMPSACDFFTSVGYKLLTGGDFLSTSSMGIRYPIKRILFAPTYIGGFGVNYSLNEHNYEFLLFADGNSSAYLDDMCQACIEGINKIIELL